MRRWRMAVAAGITLAAAVAAAPVAGAREAGAHGPESAGEPVQVLTSPLCRFSGSTWVVTGNWDGVGGDGIGIVVDDGRVLNWYLRNGPNAGPAEYAFSYGITGDQPVVGNWDGIGGDGPGIVRPTASVEWQWHLRDGNNAGPANYVFTYGRSSYMPLTGNWDGVGGDGVGVAGGDANGYKAWHLRNGPNGGIPNYDFTYGLTGFASLSNDYPMTGNWDGVGGDGPGVRRASGSQLQWHERNGLSAGPADYVFNYGLTSDCHVVGNWDGIGGDGPGIVRRNTATGRLQWHLRNGNNAGPAEAVFDYS